MFRSPENLKQEIPPYPHMSHTTAWVPSAQDGFCTLLPLMVCPFLPRSGTRPGRSGSAVSPTLITEMPRVSPSCPPAPSPSPLVTPILLPQVPCVISLSPVALLLLYDITNKSSFDNIRVGPIYPLPISIQGRASAGTTASCFVEGDGAWNTAAF